MADNVNITPGVGAVVAADEVGGALVQRVKPVFGEDGTATDPSPSNPFPVAAYGELIECLEAIRTRIGSLAASLATIQPEVTGKMRVIVSQDSNINSITSVGSVTLVPTVTTVGTVTTVATVNTVSAIANQTNIGGIAAVDHIPSMLRMSADSLRRNITVN